MLALKAILKDDQEGDRSCDAEVRVHELRRDLCDRQPLVGAGGN